MIAVNQAVRPAFTKEENVLYPTIDRLLDAGERGELVARLQAA
jgi:hypothetical protein